MTYTPQQIELWKLLGGYIDRDNQPIGCLTPTAAMVFTHALLGQQPGCNTPDVEPPIEVEIEW